VELKTNHVKIERQFNQIGDSKLTKDRNKQEFITKELDYTDERIKEHEDQDLKRQMDIEQVVKNHDEVQSEYRTELIKWHKELNFSKQRFEKLLKMYMANGDSLEDPELTQKKKEQKEHRDKMDKELRHNRLQINRMQGELQTKTVEIQRICNRYK
jgi:chromosome segregation ATPase